MKQLYLILTAVSLLFQGNLKAGEKDSISANSIIYEKVYVHTDREMYSPGDDIWMKSYLVGGINNKLIPGFKNIYIQLISDSGKVIVSKMLLSKNGSAIGDIQLPRELADGTYTIRAFTRYLQNFGLESYFHKKLRITVAKNSFEVKNKNEKEVSGKIDVSFLPEGGKLILNAINHIAFKAVNIKGKGIQVMGKIVDQNGEVVVSFSTSYKGMGRFMMMPQEGMQYFALIDDYPDFVYQFEPAFVDGISLICKTEGNYLIVTLNRNLKTTGIQNYALKASHKGIELFSSQIIMSEFQHALRLYKGLFPLGISQITLLAQNNEVVAERLVFIRNKNDKAIKVSVNKNEYQTREKVKLNITSLLDPSDSIESLSVSVVNEDYLSASGNSQSIESYLLLDSELKGTVESPALFFTDDENMQAEDKIDLLMMVNGWRNYLWNDLEKYRGHLFPNWADYGLTVKGRVIKQWGGKPLVDGKVVLGPFSSGMLFEETKTDTGGWFRFDKLYLKDQAKVMLNVKSKTGNKRADIILNKPFSIDLWVNPIHIDSVCNDIDIPLKFYRDNYYRHVAESEYLVKSGIMLDEVKAVGFKMQGDGHVRLYSEPDISMTVLDEDINRYANILDYLQGRVTGVVVTGEEIRIRGGQQNPLLLVDGIETPWSDIWSVPMGDIDKIEILKSGYGMSVYGSRGADGIISVLTKMGKGEWENNWERNINGRLVTSFRGYNQPREFYSPKYTADMLSDPKPDYRPTLFWQPEVKTETGNIYIEFYTADNLSKYRIFTEGISKSGKICCATGQFSVSMPRK